ncbi:threonine/serine exporter family protein [Cohnella sp. AR92]|uniref:threonine/serine exporter family protein n=1 Tax=Cohnella sp. AR92 TaxID=648716 RepID=UPI000F8C344B|nr:threonine/serine exporter family protein [Cohnella sp. AR92]RUS49043.1 threonine/serine exporter [Cohnella sp. AR92]
MNVAEQILTSFVAAAGFAILFNVPARNLAYCGLAGMVGWMAYRSLIEMNVDPIPATLVGSFAVSVLSQTFARLFKTPVIVFLISGIVPLVPGGTAYDAMRNVVQNQYDIAVQLAFQAFMLSGSIAFGIMFSEVFDQLIRKLRTPATGDGKRRSG